MDSPATTKCDSETGAIITQAASAEKQFRGVVAKALKRCHEIKDRQRVASELNIIANLGITKRMLDDWASPGKKGLRFPASLIRPFCEVTGDDSLALAVIPSHLRELVEVGERVCSMGRTLGEIEDRVARLAGRGSQKKAKRKGTTKAKPKRSRKA